MCLERIQLSTAETNMKSQSTARASPSSQAVASPTIIEQCWKEFPNKDLRFASVLLTASVCGVSLSEFRELSSSQVSALVANAILEWEIAGTREQEGQCICSANICQKHVIVNKLNRNVFAIGPECIKKYGDESLKRYYSILSNSKKYTGDKPACAYCGAHRVQSGTTLSLPLCKSCRESGRDRPSDEYLIALGKRCKTCKTGRVIPGSLITSCNACSSAQCKLCSCWFVGSKDSNLFCPYCIIVLKDWRICCMCNRANIAVTEERWKTKCRDCYQAPKEITGGRVCSICNKDCIPLDQPAWKTTCGPCYGKSKRGELNQETAESREPEQATTGENRPCSVCRKKTIDSTEPKYKTICSPCYKYRMN